MLLLVNLLVPNSVGGGGGGGGCLTLYVWRWGMVSFQYARVHS